MKNLAEFDISGFRGTQQHYEHCVMNLKLLLTEGTHYVRQQAKARWLFDTILFYQKDSRIDEEFQHWKLRKLERGGWILLCEDGNGKLQVTENIAYSDFPVDAINFYVMDGVCLLESEN